MTSDLGFAILGLLARAPGTGYDITRVMDGEIGYFWSARHSQIYPELARLAADGLVEFTEVQGAGPRATKRYTLTDEGRGALIDWAASEPPDSMPRNATLLRISSLWLVEPQGARALIAALRLRNVERLSLYRTFAAELDEGPASADPTRREFATRATVESGIRFHVSQIEWCDWMTARLDAGA